MYSNEDKAFVTISDRIYPVTIQGLLRVMSFVNKGADFKAGTIIEFVRLTLTAARLIVTKCQY